MLDMEGPQLRQDAHSDKGFEGLRFACPVLVGIGCGCEDIKAPHKESLILTLTTVSQAWKASQPRRNAFELEIRDSTNPIDRAPTSTFDEFAPVFQG